MKPSGNMAPFSVVVIDDNSEYLAVLLDLLKRVREVRVVAVGSNVIETVALCETHRPDILLIDAGMPEYGALTAATDIRELFPSTHIVFMTTTDSTEYGVVARMIPADAIISKSAIKQGLENEMKKIRKQ